MGEDLKVNRRQRLELAVAGFELHRTPARLKAAIKGAGFQALADQVSHDDLKRSAQSAKELFEAGVDVVVLGDEDFPKRLVNAKSAPAVLFFWGNPKLLHANSVGMCGSRNVSARGLEAARTCGLKVAETGLIIVSGYAKGVDTETHLAALDSGGRTVIVLAEGIAGFKRKRAFDGSRFSEETILAVSQFAPNQPWNVGAAMQRNGTIAGLSRALVVIEAGETGGTLDAGYKALSMGRPVLALTFETQETPAGNELLFERGAIRIANRKQLAQVLESIRETPTSEDLSGEQLSLLR